MQHFDPCDCAKKSYWAGSPVAGFAGFPQGYLGSYASDASADAVDTVTDPFTERFLSEALVSSGLSLAVAESLTGGLLSARVARLERASEFFRGGIVAYQSRVKFDVLEVTPGPVVTQRSADEMALGVQRLLEADIALGVTGVGGPGPSESKPPGTVFVTLAFVDQQFRRALHLHGDPADVCRQTCDRCLELLRSSLSERSGFRASRR